MLDFGFYNMDCMEGMKEFPDNYFELAIVDPLYGIGMDGGNVGYAGNNNFKKKNWDNQPPKEIYFSELMRVSKNQIMAEQMSLQLHKYGNRHMGEFIVTTKW